MGCDEGDIRAGLIKGRAPCLSQSDAEFSCSGSLENTKLEGLLVWECFLGVIERVAPVAALFYFRDNVAVTVLVDKEFDVVFVRGVCCDGDVEGVVDLDF